MTGEVNSSEAIASAWDGLVETYAEMVADPAKRGCAVEIELAAFERALPGTSGLELLDAGCGIGVHGCRLLQQGHKVTFVDVSPKMVERARQAAAQIEGGGAASFHEMDIREMPSLPDASFDGVISGGATISDCGGPTEAMAELSRVLRPGGVTGISLRNLDGPDAPEAGDIVRRGHEAFDSWFFSVESAGELGRGAGLEPECIVPVFMTKPPAGPDKIHDYLRTHLDATDTDDWRGRAWEFFVIARGV